MDWSQLLYMSLLAVAVSIERGWISAIMVANFLATVAFSGSPLMVAVADMASIASLISLRAWIIAALFVAMQPVYLAGYWFDVSNAATYAIVDLIAYLQLVVMCRGIGGLLDRHRSDRGWLSGRRILVSGRGDARNSPARVARNLAKDGR